MFWEAAIRYETEETEKRYWEKFGRQMGTTWYRSDFEEPKDGKRKAPVLRDPNTLFYPHSLLTSPNNVFKQIKKDFESSKPRVAGGDYMPEKGEEIVDTSELSTEEFKSFFTQFQQGLTGRGG